MTTTEDQELAAQLGHQFAERCTCGHVLVTSNEVITVPQVLPCCETGRCLYCESGGDASYAMDDAEGDHNHDPGHPPGAERNFEHEKTDE